MLFSGVKKKEDKFKGASASFPPPPPPHLVVVALVMWNYIRKLCSDL